MMASVLFSFFVVVLFPALMAMSASLDLLTMTIPNRIPVALVLGYITLAAMTGMPPQLIALDLSCGLSILLVTFLMFSLSWIGGGDAKLAAATAVWMGWSSIFSYGVLAAICGGLLTFGILAARARPLPAILARQNWLARLHESKTGVPYGVALAAAGMIEYPHSQLWADALR
jgi:prepilin peptidase CpaA